MSSQPNNVWTIDPLRDDRWPDLVARHPKATVFHTRGWLKALLATYGYQPLAFTTSPPTETLTDGVVFCGVRSWLTGHRLVSLPFSDHCEPLVDHSDRLRMVCVHLSSLVGREGWNYVEMRSADPSVRSTGCFVEAATYTLHRLDLHPDLGTVYGRLHKDCIQRKIKRAERESLRYVSGRSLQFLHDLYGLLQLTRARHHVPPQPFAWFHNLVDCLGDALCIRLAYRDERPIAGMLTLSDGKRMVYKYGGSDAAFHHLGAMPYLFWRAITEAKEAGAEELDLGRSDLDQPGLIMFKDRWSAVRTPLVTWRMPASSVSGPGGSVTQRYAKQVLKRLPEPVVALAGRLLYRHMG